MVGTDRFTKDASKLMLPLAWVGGIVTAVLLIGAAGYQIRDNTVRINKNDTKIQINQEAMTDIKINSARLEAHLENIGNDISDIKDLLKSRQ